MSPPWVEFSLIAGKGGVVQAKADVFQQQGLYYSERKVFNFTLQRHSPRGPAVGVAVLITGTTKMLPLFCSQKYFELCTLSDTKLANKASGMGCTGCFHAKRTRAGGPSSYPVKSLATRWTEASCSAWVSAKRMAMSRKSSWMARKASTISGSKWVPREFLMISTASSWGKGGL